MKKPYYTALSKEDIVSKYKPLNMVDINGSVAMAWDIELCYLPKEYNKVDVLYTELAWEAGYEKFHSRANTTPTSYKHYCECVSNIILSTNKPTVIVCGSKAAETFT